MTSAPESYAEWEKRTRPSGSVRPLWRSPGEILTVVFLAVAGAADHTGLVPAVLPLVAFGAAERLITSVAVARGLSVRIALVLRFLGTAALVTYALLPPTWWGAALVLLVLVSEWFAAEPAAGHGLPCPPTNERAVVPSPP